MAGLTVEQFGFLLETAAFFLVTIDLYGEKGPERFKNTWRRISESDNFTNIVFFMCAMSIAMPFLMYTAWYDGFEDASRLSVRPWWHQEPYATIFLLLLFIVGSIPALLALILLRWLLKRINLNNAFLWIGVTMFILARIMTFPN